MCGLHTLVFCNTHLLETINTDIQSKNLTCDYLSFVDSEAWKSSFPVDVDEAKCEQSDSPVACRVRVVENHG